MDNEYTIPDGVRYAWHPNTHKAFIYALNKLYPGIDQGLKPTQRTVDACLLLGLGLLSVDYGLELSYKMVSKRGIELTVRYTLNKYPVPNDEKVRTQRHPLPKVIMVAMGMLTSIIHTDLLYSEKLPQNKM